MSGTTIEQILGDNSIVLCGGNGGVGKTTTAAALGTIAAGLGRRTLVVTIDPARRLAHAMGLDGLASAPQQVPQVPGLSAMMLDAGQTFDDLVARYATSEATRHAILDNPYYQQFAATLAGSREFMAMEKVYELASSDDYDLLIVDTPPTRHALDFLDAPKRLTEILSGSGLTMILKTANLTNRLTLGLASKSRDQFLKLFEKLTGHRLLVDVTTFFDAFGKIFKDFHARSEKLQLLLSGERTCFVLVVAPDAELVDETHEYARRLDAERMAIGAVIVNRVHELPGNRGVSQARLAELLDDDDLAARARASYRDWRELAKADAKVIDALQVRGSIAQIRVPRFTRDISSIDDLTAFAGCLTRVAD